MGHDDYLHAEDKEVFCWGEVWIQTKLLTAQPKPFCLIVCLLYIKSPWPGRKMPSNCELIMRLRQPPGRYPVVEISCAFFQPFTRQHLVFSEILSMFSFSNYSCNCTLNLKRGRRSLPYFRHNFPLLLTKTADTWCTLFWRTDRRGRGLVHEES